MKEEKSRKKYLGNIIGFMVNVLVTSVLTLLILTILAYMLFNFLKKKIKNYIINRYISGTDCQAKELKVDNTTVDTNNIFYMDINSEKSDNILDRLSKLINELNDLKITTVSEIKEMQIIPLQDQDVTFLKNTIFKVEDGDRKPKHQSKTILSDFWSKIVSRNDNDSNPPISDLWSDLWYISKIKTTKDTDTKVYTKNNEHQVVFDLKNFGTLDTKENVKLEDMKSVSSYCEYGDELCWLNSFVYRWIGDGAVATMLSIYFIGKSFIVYDVFYNNSKKYYILAPQPPESNTRSYKLASISSIYKVIVTKNDEMPMRENIKSLVLKLLDAGYDGIFYTVNKDPKNIKCVILNSFSKTLVRNFIDDNPIKTN